ncbi:hypothetical protein [Pseudoalteromonas byunsanensis]|uniref:Uncharacterized protein n=1 Tax=Pseudoalteromonas byunsanensis TaxID=327939 RepID=A0A1S1N6E8_9GAMM|nr:hypothetical protein [Pseudoalteromonas byunsanensis]OHU94991.1 hypothetical protein BIW53_13320 [Pseudoalteromonas byunsanensis]
MVNGVSVGKVSTTLAAGVPGTITFFDNNNNETYQISLNADFDKSDSNYATMVDHTVHEKISDSWAELINAQMTFHHDMQGSVTLYSNNSQNVTITGKVTPKML